MVMDGHQKVPQLSESGTLIDLAVHLFSQTHQMLITLDLSSL